MSKLYKLLIETIPSSKWGVSQVKLLEDYLIYCLPEHPCIYYNMSGTVSIGNKDYDASIFDQDNPLIPAMMHGNGNDLIIKKDTEYTCYYHPHQTFTKNSIEGTKIKYTGAVLGGMIGFKTKDLDYIKNLIQSTIDSADQETKEAVFALSATFHSCSNLFPGFTKASNSAFMNGILHDLPAAKLIYINIKLNSLTDEDHDQLKEFIIEQAKICEYSIPKEKIEQVHQHVDKCKEVFGKTLIESAFQTPTPQ